MKITPPQLHAGGVGRQQHSIGSVYIGGYCGLTKNELCVFGKLCPVGFLVVCVCSSVLLQSVVMSYVDCGDDG